MSGDDPKSSWHELHDMKSVERESLAQKLAASLSCFCFRDRRHSAQMILSALEALRSLTCHKSRTQQLRMMHLVTPRLGKSAETCDGSV